MNAHLKVPCLAAGMAAGADSIDDMDPLRHGAMGTLFAGVRAPSTLGSNLRSYTWGNVQQLEKAGREFLARLARAAPLLPGKEVLAFVDIDSVQKRVYGYRKQGARFGCTKIAGKQVAVLGLNALAATISTPLSAPVIAATRLRGGNAASVRGAAGLADAEPGLVPALLALVEPEERGDPMSPLRWMVKSTRTRAAELARQGREVSAGTVAGLLRGQRFSLQGSARVIEGSSHPDRDAQFRYINGQAAAFQAAGEPVISVDVEKKEMVGEFGNAGRQWRPKGAPARVRDYDFASDSEGKAIPYGIYDLAADAGWVSVGTDHDTAAFAVEMIRRWWDARGRLDYPAAGRLLITADADGSNGHRPRAWKAALGAFALETGLEVTVCHFPPGTQCRCLSAAKYRFAGGRP